MLERVTVAVDGGPASDAAVRWACERARGSRMQLELTSVLSTDSLRPELDDDVRIEFLLEELKAKIVAELPGLAVSTRIRRGVAHDALISASGHTDLLVIGTNKTSRVAGILHGTLPLRVAGRSRCTTVVVPFDWQPTVGQVVAGWTDDETADTALDLAADEAQRQSAPLTIVSTWVTGGASMMDPASSAIVAEEVSASKRLLLHDAANRIRLDHPSVVVTEELVAGSAAAAILLAASGAALVVVGSRGRGAMAGFFLGSVSHELLLSMPSPVAVVPRHDVPVNVYPEILEEDVV